MRTTAIRFVGLLGLIFAASVAAAQDSYPSDTRYLGDRFSVRIMGGVVYLNTDVSAGRNLGALIDLEDVLGFDESISTFGLEGFWRFTKSGKNALKFRYGNFDRAAYKSVEGSVPILDVEFFGDLESEFVNQVLQLEYQYSFVNTGKTEAGFSAGLATYKYDLSLDGQIVIDDNPDEAEFRSESVGVVAPVPGIGFFINHAFRKNLIFELSTSFIDLEIGDHDGRIFRTWGAVTWYFSKHFGVGLGLAGSDVFYENSGGSEKIKVQLRQSGLVANLTAVF
jgi:hypothetical protein